MIQYVHPEQVFQLDIEVYQANRKKIGNIMNTGNRQMTLRLGQLTEFSFSAPYKIQKYGKMIRNPELDKLKSPFHYKVTLNGQSEWFIVSNLTSNGVDKNIMDIQLKSLGYQLAKKKIRSWPGIYIDGEYRKESLSPQQVLNDILSVTVWSIGTIDGELLTKYRSFDFSNTSRLDAIYTVASTFGGIVQWDTINKTVSLFKQENVGVDTGLSIHYGKYLKSLSKEEIPDEVVTRLHLFGQENLSIHRVNPLGTSYIEDFSYYMTGFERDVNKITISSSINGMSDELCHALLDYKEVVQSKQGQFTTLVTQSETLEDEKGQIEIDISLLDEQIKAEENVIDVKQTQDPQVDAAANLANLAELEAQMTAKQAELEAKNQAIIDNLTAIEQVKSSLQIDNNLSDTLMQELDDYIFEDTWEDSNYTDDRELYEDGIKVFMDLNKPKIVVSADIINLYKVLDRRTQLDAKKLVPGNKFRIDYPEFDIKQESQLLELSIDFDGNSVSVQIANVADYTNDDEKLAKYLADSVSTGSTVDMSKYSWNSVNDVQTDVRQIIEDFRKGAKVNIESAVDNTVQINHRGITTVSNSDPLKGIRITNSVIGLSKDGFNTFSTAITPDGIVSERLIGRIVIGENLFLENQGGGKFRFDQDGVTLDGSAIEIVGGLPKSQMDITGLVETDVTYTNGIRIDTTEGLVVTRSDDKARSIFNATSGMKFQVKVGSSWQDRLYYDINNNRLVVNGEGNFSELKVNGQSVLTSSKTKIDGSYIANLNADTITTGTLEGITIKSVLDSSNYTQIQTGSVTNKGLGLTLELIGGAARFTNDSYPSERLAITAGFISKVGSLDLYASEELLINSRYSGSYTRFYNYVDFSNVTDINWGSHAPSTTATFG